MTERDFLISITNDSEDFLGKFFTLLKKLKIDYCIIGGLAVNAYVEPVISLDLGLAVAVGSLNKLISEAKKYFKVKEFPHSYNLSSQKSDIRIQIQKDVRYQDFLKNARVKNVLGYELRVASIEDVLLGKIWAYSDNQRRPSKRQKDLVDILRLIESYPRLKSKLPQDIKKKIF